MQVYVNICSSLCSWVGVFFGVFMFILFLVPISFGLVVVSCFGYFCTCAVFSSILYFHVSLLCIVNHSYTHFAVSLIMLMFS